MEHHFKSAKVQFKMVSDTYPDGIIHSYNDLIDNVTDEQLTGCLKALGELSTEKMLYAHIVTTNELLN